MGRVRGAEPAGERFGEDIETCRHEESEGQIRPENRVNCLLVFLRLEDQGGGETRPADHRQELHDGKRHGHRAEFFRAQEPCQNGHGDKFKPECACLG